MTETERAKQLAYDHWDGYNGPLLEAAGLDASELKLAKFVYTAAAQHFYGHAIEDERAGMFRQMTPARYAEIHTPLTTGEIAAITRPCKSCYDEDACKGGLRLASGDCLHHRPKDAKSCKNCDCFDHCVRQRGGGSCLGWQPKVADQQHPRKEG